MIYLFENMSVLILLINLSPITIPIQIVHLRIFLFRPVFQNGHGNFNYYLHRFNLFHTSTCDCGFHEQDSLHK
ncbi:hypothetical protein DERP_015345 [Dermatophagoides pteronyssinus]|uniref:Uncharacterized protein n=1 Tax=Dermatophagoides pteronyssinus TaxID=6956 RepID=A0ABQ8JXU7_DERPT|nr:hypothetical protein DERP_015345 [Dermatophagoides pteronyssinus]